MLRKMGRIARAGLRRLSRTERHLRRGRWFASVGDWSAAAAAFGSAAALAPRRGAILVQWGHALKEGGEADRAVAAYRNAAALDRRDLDVRLHLADVLRRRGRDADRVAAQALYREILLLDPTSREALRALIDMGARSSVPAVVLSPEAALASRRDVSALIDALRDAKLAAEACTTFPLNLYTTFRERHPLAPPPTTAATDIVAVVLAVDGSAAMIGATIGSLKRQSIAVARVVVVAPQAIFDHPVAGVYQDDVAVCFVSTADAPAMLDQIGAAVALPAGAILEEHAAAWLTFARDRTGASLVYGDHDELTEDALFGSYRDRPVLFGAHDPILLRNVAQPPAAILTTGKALMASVRDGSGDWAAIVAVVTRAAAAVHVPRILASRYGLPLSIRHAPTETPEIPKTPETRGSPLPAQSAGRFRVPLAIIIPTRDQAAMLHRAVNSMIATAGAPDRLAFVIVDNRSSESETATLLAELRSDGATIVNLDGPFNWSRANNIGAAATTAEVLVFANNDVEALTRGWDDLIERRLSHPGVGVLGARLLYADRSYQHAGVVFGVGQGLSLHEAVGHQVTDGGPNQRWFAARRTSAVTGAFLTCSRTTFATIGGFDEGLAVAYNDLDFCFRARERGLAVVYEPDLCLIHHESRTRGHNVLQCQLAWDERERITFVERWSSQVVERDPAYNPQWARDGLPFDGMREPSLEEIIAWIDAGAADPWRPGTP